MVQRTEGPRHLGLPLLAIDPWVAPLTTEYVRSGSFPEWDIGLDAFASKPMVLKAGRPNTEREGVGLVESKR